MGITKQKARWINVGLYLPGIIIYLLALYFAEQISDFQLGFMEGVSIVFIVAGLVYSVWCIAHFRKYLFTR